ncbi:response regulator transcription factor [Dyella sp. M7H15-1]|uniref:response regulator transcription factor n=1 Tax=Dyella sp. M7H15-1 TaxID=2501295 RepID=UPI001004E80F|nr:response regulator transcription factor [Dyella sp. M7H15-1]QAU22918.1 response regulator transcription factor [Dyella sp. M7H15-1]
MRIVIADSCPITRLGLRALLREQPGGHEVVADVASGHQLLDTLAAHPCDLCITDFFMPVVKDELEVGGLSLLRAMLKCVPLLPIVVWSGVKNTAVMRSMLSEGMRALVDKDSHPADITRAIQAIKVGRCFVSESLREYLSTVDHPVTRMPVTPGPAFILSPCEAEILRCLADGWIISTIARHSGRSIKTISQHKHNAMRKLGLTSDYALFEYMLAGGLALAS